ERQNKVESEVVRSEGSTLIGERVFDKILEAEKESQKNGRQEVSITPANYRFTLLGRENCGARACHHLQIVPKQKTKYSINGQIWVDVEDGAIVRIQGTPARRPSIWTRETEIDRRYRRFDGIWLCETMESNSDVLIAGRSTLKVDYKYLSIREDSNLRTN